MYEFLIQTNIPIFHHSIIPSGLHETCSIKNAVISVSYRISETFSSLRSQLEYWNYGIMGFGGMGYWDVDKAPLDSEVNKGVSFL